MVQGWYERHRSYKREVQRGNNRDCCGGVAWLAWYTEKVKRIAIDKLDIASYEQRTQGQEKLTQTDTWQQSM